jgi:hypothetical protein
MEGDNKENKKDDGKKKMSKEDRIAARQAPKVHINRFNSKKTYRKTSKFVPWVQNVSTRFFVAC